MYFYKERFKVAHMKKHGGLMKTYTNLNWQSGKK